MAHLTVLYVSRKVNKIRWKPEVEHDEKTFFVTGSWDNNESNTISLWNCANETSQEDKSITDDVPEVDPKLLSEVQHIGDVQDLAFLSSNLLVSASSIGSVSISKILNHNITHLQCWEGLHKYKNQGAAACTGIAIKSDQITSVGEDGRIVVLNTAKKQPLWTKKVESCSLTSVQYIRHQEIGVGTIKGHLNIWDLKSKQDKPSKTLSHSNQQIPITCMSQHPSQAHVVAAGGEDGLLTIWDLRQDLYPVSALSGHSAAIAEIEFHPKNPEYLYSASLDGTLCQWNASNLKGPNMVQASKASDISKLQAVNNPWLNSAAMKNRLEIDSLLPPLTCPVSSLNIEDNTLICSSDNEAIFVVSNLK